MSSSTDCTKKACVFTLEPRPREDTPKPTPVAAKKPGSGWQPAPPLADVERGRRALGRGHHGDSVAKAQEMLGGVEVDGYFGPRTQAAVHGFQASWGLERERGRVGEGTLAALERWSREPEAMVDDYRQILRGKLPHEVAATLDELASTPQYAALSPTEKKEVLDRIAEATDPKEVAKGFLSFAKQNALPFYMGVLRAPAGAVRA